MLSGSREVIAGVVRDPQFGSCVMFGFGGILAEAIADVEFRLAPINSYDARDLISSLKTTELLKEFRGEQKQVPPMYSAKKNKGIPLYKWQNSVVS